MSGKLKLPDAKGSSRIVPPATASKGSTNHLNPVFCFRYLKGVDSFPSEVCAALARMLRDLGQLTWQQIMFTQRKGMGFEKIGRKQILADLHASTDALEFVLSFRLSGEWRLIGHRVDEVLRVLYAGADAYDH